MYSKILVPVDLAHPDSLEKALRTAADLATHYKIPVCYVGVTAPTPGPVAHNPKEFAAKLEAFAKEQGEAFGIGVEALPVTSHDPAIDLDATLLHAIDTAKADLIVMGSHIPGKIEHLFASNAGYVAAHAKVTVMIVR